MSYPWSHLVSQPFVDDGKITDLVDLKNEQQSLASSLQNTQKNFESLEKISATTVDDLRAEMERLSTENDTLTSRIEELETAAAEAAPTTPAEPYPELVTCIVTQKVIAHSRNLEGTEATKRVLKGVYEWMQQKQRISDYLKQHPELGYADRFDTLLQLTKDDIVNLITHIMSS